MSYDMPIETVLKMRNGDTVARENVALYVEFVQPDTGEHFVQVKVWDESSEKYERVGNNLEALAVVSGLELENFLSGVNPSTVDYVLENYR